MRRLLPLLLCVGCNSQALSAGEDGGASGQCVSHQRSATPVADLIVLADNPSYGALFRIEFDVPLRPCDAFADVAVQVMPGDATDLVKLTAFAWQGSGRCDGPVIAVRRNVALSEELGLSSPNIMVVDGAPGSTQVASLTVEPMSSGGCSAVPADGACQLDCQCAATDPALRCVDGTCNLPCSVDVDCPSNMVCGSYLICHPLQGNGCAEGCNWSESCVLHRCEVSAEASGGNCSCDGDCGQGQLCDGHHCLIPCTTVADCPPPYDLCVEGQCSATI